MSASLLRRAAAKLRETASEAAPGPWAVGGETGNFPDLVGPVGGHARIEACVEDAPWIALASPALAEPLAAWLEHDADMLDAFVNRDKVPLSNALPVVEHALTVARAVLGEPEPPYPPRRNTPPRPSLNGGTTHTVKRYCNGCGQCLGDADAAELEGSVQGLPLPDVRSECPRCSQNGGETR